MVRSLTLFSSIVTTLCRNHNSHPTKSACHSALISGVVIKLTLYKGNDILGVARVR